jgi:hypothetical protein
MKRRILIAVLALGTVGGFGMGFASMRCNARHRRAAFEQHVAKVCVDAARGEQARAHRGGRGWGPESTD